MVGFTGILCRVLAALGVVGPKDCDGVAVAAPAPVPAVNPAVVTSVSAADILLLFHRPAEPVFTLRGVNRDAAFDVPVEYLPDRFRNVSDVIAKTARQAGVRLIPVPLLDMPEEDFSDIPASLGYLDEYSRAGPVHLNMAVRFEAFFSNSSDNAELLARGVWSLLHFNPEMVLDGLRNALVRRPGAQQGVQMLELPQYFPDYFVDDLFFARARQEMYLLSEDNRLVIPVIRNETQKDTVESKLWYWLEDANRNVMHWRFHIVYPTCCDLKADADRHGEIFVYFHRQMIARYNAERLINGGGLVQPLNYWQPIRESHFPKMTNLRRNKGFLGRQANTSLLAGYASLQLYDRWTERYRDALEFGHLISATGEFIPLSGIDGLDRIANELEPNSMRALNTNFYGMLHNMLHGLLIGAHDPAGIDNEADSALMGTIVPVSRDPAFYRIHMHLDNLYEEYKEKYLAPYTEEEVSWPGMTVESLSVTSQVTGATNELHTHYQETDLDLSLGLDYTPPGRIYGRFQHLQHEAFEYKIEIRNEQGAEKRAFVRVFLLIAEDEKGQPLDLRTQQRYAIEMDRFDATLSPGVTSVSRSSKSSALTVDADTVYGQQQSVSQAQRSNQCRCGWPQSLLVPRGTPAGTPYRLFVMITDYDEDKTPPSVGEVCHDGWILCGVANSMTYPDKKPMGFPFDRAFRANVTTLDDFLTSNMAVQDIVVKFDEGRVDPPGPLLAGGASTTWMPS